MSSPPQPPDRGKLRARLFWAARWLLGGAVFHAGGLRVVIDDDDDDTSGQTIIIRPRRGDAEVNPDGPPSPYGPPVLAKLLASCLSADAFAIMEFVAQRGPVAAKAVAAGVAVERSKCYVLLTDLRDRGLIGDRGDGYEVADPELWREVVAARAERKAAA